MSYTKGPWYVDCGLIKKAGGLDWIKDKPIAGVRYGVGIDDEANAQLIAAAPDLLEACKLAKEYLLTIAHDPEHLIIQKLEAAIAKAEAHNG